MFSLSSADDLEAVQAGSIVMLENHCPFVDGACRLLDVRVKRIRDLVRQPLTPKELLRRPYARWTRFCLYGEALDRPGIVRRFNLGKVAEQHQPPSPLRVGFYEPGGRCAKWEFPKPFGHSEADRLLLVLLVRELDRRAKTDFPSLLLRIFPDGITGW